MNLAEFERVLNKQRAAEDDRTWFPKWYARFEEFLDQTRQSASDVNRAAVVAFSRSLLNSGTSAWQRLQAVRAVATYHSLVLGNVIPDLDSVMQTLSRLATQERQFGVENLPGVADEPQLVGTIVNIGAIHRDCVREVSTVDGRGVDGSNKGA